MALVIADHFVAQALDWRFIWPDQAMTPVAGLYELVTSIAIVAWPSRPDPSDPQPVRMPGAWWTVSAAVIGALIGLALSAGLTLDPWEDARCPAAMAQGVDCSRFGALGQLYSAELLVRANQRLDNNSNLDALRDIERALFLRPNFAFAWNSRGIGEQALGRSDAAIADYNRSLALSPAYLAAHANRGSLYQALGDATRAAADFDLVYDADFKSYGRAAVLPFVREVDRRRGNEPPAGWELMPPLSDGSYRLQSIRLGSDGRETGDSIVEYRVPKADRREFYSRKESAPAYVSIENFATGDSHFLNVRTGHDSIERIRTDSGAPRYWEGVGWAIRGGTCSYAGETGVQWKRPRSGYILERTICLSKDGIILASSAARSDSTVAVKLQRGPEPEALFIVPTGPGTIAEKTEGAIQRVAAARGRP